MNKNTDIETLLPTFTHHTIFTHHATDSKNGIKELEKFMNASLEAEIEDVEKLQGNTPNGTVIDADTILADYLGDFASPDSNGVAKEIFEIFRYSSDKKAVIDMFQAFTGISFSDYLKECKEKISREE